MPETLQTHLDSCQQLLPFKVMGTTVLKGERELGLHREEQGDLASSTYGVAVIYS